MTTKQMTNSMQVYATVKEMQNLLTILDSLPIDKEYWPTSLRKVEQLLGNAEHNLSQVVAEQALARALKETHDLS